MDENFKVPYYFFFYSHNSDLYSIARWIVLIYDHLLLILTLSIMLEKGHSLSPAECKQKVEDLLQTYNRKEEGYTLSALYEMVASASTGGVRFLRFKL